LPDVMLNIRIRDLVLGGHILESVVVGSLGRAQEGGGIMRDETGLPPFLQILTRVSNQIAIRNKRTMEMDQMTGGGSHADRIPPRGIYLHGGIGEVAS